MPIEIKVRPISLARTTTMNPYCPEDFTMSNSTVGYGVAVIAIALASVVTAAATTMIVSRYHRKVVASVKKENRDIKEENDNLTFRQRLYNEKIAIVEGRLSVLIDNHAQQTAAMQAQADFMSESLNLISGRYADAMDALAEAYDEPIDIEGEKPTTPYRQAAWIVRSSLSECQASMFLSQFKKQSA
jgi:hypothetical protein